jgi:hypothetical protein
MRAFPDMPQLQSFTAACFSRPALVDVQILALVFTAAKCDVAAFHQDLDDPGDNSSCDAEAGAGSHGRNVAGLIFGRPQVGSPDEAHVHDRSDHADSHSLLLLGLATYTAAPAEDQTIDAVCAYEEEV